MSEHVEVVHVIGRHLFNAECYECATLPESVRERGSGYYAVVWPDGAPAHRYDAGATFIGPFATAWQAEGVTDRDHGD